MAKLKKKFKIYKYDVFTNSYGQQKTEPRYVGCTMAVSEKQAINNYLYRNNITYSQLYAETGADSDWTVEFLAKEA